MGKITIIKPSHKNKPLTNIMIAFYDRGCFSRDIARAHEFFDPYTPPRARICADRFAKCRLSDADGFSTQAMYLSCYSFDYPGGASAPFGVGGARKLKLKSRRNNLQYIGNMNQVG